MFKLRKEVGLSELISLGALIISGAAFWYSTQPEGGHIISGGGTIYTSVIKGEQCTYVLTLPVEFHNSGKQAVTLEQLTQGADIPTVLFSNQESILDSKAIKHRIYLSNSNIGAIPSFWLKNLGNHNEFTPSYKHIGDLIHPSESYRFYVVLTIAPYTQIERMEEVSAFIKFNAVFGNGQIIPISAAVELNKYDSTKCS